jgi:HAE1 family hydrophobic/amphiphilic exporter-1
MAYHVALDTTAAVNAGIHEILVTLFIALALVILVVYIFLQGWRATLIPLLAVPVSLIGTFMVFPLLGFSINTLSLFGLVLAIGLVVDDAIVVVEAVEHHIEEGMTPLDASYAAMEQVASPVIAIALILAAVFIPTAFIPGITGRLYQQFAVTIAISVLFSAFNALTLSPALCALLLKPKTKSKGLLWLASSTGSIASSKRTPTVMSAPPAGWCASPSSACHHPRCSALCAAAGCQGFRAASCQPKIRAMPSSRCNFRRAPP